MIPFALSKVTLYSLLLGLMLASGIGVWDAGQTDNCARYLAGDKSQPATQTVISGSRLVVVPCTNWIGRQPLWVQVLCLVDGALGVLFVLNLLSDLRAWLQMRRQWRTMR